MFSQASSGFVSITTGKCIHLLALILFLQYFTALCSAQASVAITVM